MHVPLCSYRMFLHQMRKGVDQNLSEPSNELVFRYTTEFRLALAGWSAQKACYLL